MQQQQQRCVGISSNPISYPSTGAVGMYPSMAPQAGVLQVQEVGASAPPPYSLTPTAPSTADSRSLRQYHTPLYPTLNDYMGLDLSPETIALNMPEYASMAVAVVPPVCVCGFLFFQLCFYSFCYYFYFNSF